MILYHCMIDLRPDAQALLFARAAESWFSLLQMRGLIGKWRILRRNFGLASGPHPDFILEIEMRGMATLDEAFGRLALEADDEEVAGAYEHFHAMIGAVHVGLYRPWPDPALRERIALI